MKYAIVNNERVEAQKGMKGNCPVCNKPVIARCGEFKVNHWAHTKSAHCDKWWEAETEWHRAWKDLFPKEWQEVIAYDEKWPLSLPARSLMDSLTDAFRTV